MHRTIAIAGGGHAAGRAVRVLRDEGFDGRILVVGEERDPPYERPALSKEFLRGDHGIEKCLINAADVYGDGRTELLLGSRVAAIDARDRRLITEGGKAVAFDALLIATGTRARTLDGLPVCGEVVHTLRSAADALRLKPRLVPGARVVLIGGGFIGLEVAASARTLGCEVTVLEAAPALLARVVGGATIGRHVEALHRAQGVTVKTGFRIERIETRPDGATVHGNDGARIEADVLVVGVGAVPNAEVAAAAGLECNDGIVVDGRGRTSVEGIHAVGDVARHPSAFHGRSIRLETWDNAERQTAVACRAMLGREERYDAVPWMWTDQFGMNLQMLGLPGPCEAEVVRGDPASGRFITLALNGGRVTSAVLVNMGRERRPLTGLMERGVHVTPAELADESVPLRNLLQRAAG